MLIIDENDLATIVSSVGLDELMDEIIDDIVQFCLHSVDDSEFRPRDGFHYQEPQIGLLEWMPVFTKGDRVTIKVVGYHPQNPSLFGMPTIVGSIGTYDTRNGSMLALADGTLPTALRTGAASAAASELLADPGSSVVGIIGCGAQAVTQCHALFRRFPVEQILIDDANRENRDSFARRLSRLCPPGIDIKAADKTEIFAESDIICTCTSIETGKGPLIEDPVETRAGLHINAVGSDFPGKIELPKALLRRATVIPDHLEQCVAEGECQQLEAGEIGPELWQLISDPESCRELRRELTVFDSTGWAAEDQIMMDIIVRYAEALNLGTSISLHSSPEDPLNPYQNIRRLAPALMRRM